MTDQRKFLVNFVPVGLGQWNVSGIGGTSLPVAGQGDVIIRSTVNDKVFDGNNFFFLLCIKGEN